MRVLVDNRAGSADLAEPLIALGCDAKLTRLDSADVAWTGRGREDRPVRVGVEMKTVPELLQAMDTGRLAGHQIPAMQAAYEEVWVLIVGRVQPSSPGGLLEYQLHEKQVRWWEPRGRSWTLTEFEKRLHTLTLKAGVKVKQVAHPRAAVWWLHAVSQWWAEGYERHKSFRALYSHVSQAKEDNPVIDLTKFSYNQQQWMLRHMAAQLPGIGWERSAAILDVFKNPRDMVNADVERWRKVKGIGRTLAPKFVRLMKGEKP